MPSGSDTHIGRAESDTVCLGFSPGQSVRISVGLMEGFEAVVVQQRMRGRVLVRLEPGVFVEIHQFCLEKITKIQEQA
jgi:transcription antitermination factor NusG